MIARIIMSSVVMFIDMKCSLSVKFAALKCTGIDTCPAKSPAKVGGKILQMFMTIYGDF
jgi:hypothetical protein